MNIKLDKWQEEVLETEGNMCLRSGRQVGKSTIISIKAADFALKNRNKTIMVIASVERQAQLLFEKILSEIVTNFPKMIMKGKDKPTKHVIKLINGSVIHCLPTGLSGYGIRGYTIDLLIADEAAFIQEAVWTAVTPMLAVTKGVIWLLSTPHGKYIKLPNGKRIKPYYVRCFDNENFTSFHISAEDSPRKDVKFLEREKARMTKVEYAQEYLGEFMEGFMQFFDDELIRKCMLLERKPRGHNDHYLGVDIARMGEDESTFEVLEMIGDMLYHRENEVTRKQYLTETISKIKVMDNKWDFKKIYIDDGGIGVGVFDQLLTDTKFKRRVVPINNARRSLDKDERVKKRLLKEDLYNNLKVLMEKGKIQLLIDPEIFHSLKSVQFEYLDGGNLKISGNDTHIAEGLIRAAWCVKEKHLKFAIHYI